METVTSDCCGVLYVASLCEKNTFTVKPQQKLPFDFLKAKEKILKLYPGKNRGKLSCEFKFGNVTISLLKNFAMNISGVENVEEAVDIYQHIISIIRKQS